MGKKNHVEKTDKVPFQMRFEPEVYARVKELAEAADISVNQLMQGLAAWAGENGRAGEPVRDEAGCLQLRPVPGCVFFGKPAQWQQEEDGASWVSEKGVVFFVLDFTVRRVVRDS